MKEESVQEIKDLIGVLIADGYIKVLGLDYPILALTEKSKEILFSEVKFFARETQDKTVVKNKSRELVNDDEENLLKDLKK